MVIWLIGISGAGKSTLGAGLKNYFDKQNIAAALIDGDIVREFFEQDLGYSVNDRKQNIKRIIFAAHMLEEQGVVPIVCNISPFEELRDFAARKLQDYVQVFLKKNPIVASQNDVKGVYKDKLPNTPLVGFDIEFEEPIDSAVELCVDNQTVEESLTEILEYLAGRN